jgi:citrate/tricarballylate utilization protein
MREGTDADRRKSRMNAHAPIARPHAGAQLEEADRLMTVCNSCRYCEGLCAVFPAMEMRRAFGDGDLNYLANLCHGCGACLADCQFSPPHEFNVNVPRTLAKVRADSYQAYAWPPAFRPAFERNGLVISIVTALAVAAFVAGFVAWHDAAVLFGAHDGPGAFYRLMPHSAMAVLFVAVTLYAVLAAFMSLRAFWNDVGEARRRVTEPSSLWQAVKDAGTLRYLDGGGVGCMNEDDRPTDNRRFFHHLTFYGFLLCFAATSVATAYHYLLGREAPYPWYDLPVLLGGAGGLGLIAGPLGLLHAKRSRDPQLSQSSTTGMDVGFLVMLLLTSVTGMLLLVLRATPAMGLLLALHLGVVFSLFLTMPYGKFMHGPYRFLALVKYAAERRELDDR